MRLDDQDANLAEATATVKDRYPDLEALYQEVEWVADPLVWHRLTLKDTS